MDDPHISLTGSGGDSDKDRLIEQLREAVGARDEFVAIAAHELRNPMTPILMQVRGRGCRSRLSADRRQDC